MRALRRAPFLAVVFASSLLPSGRAQAEDTKGKWQFGCGLSYFSTIDYIRSNADIAIAEGTIGPNGLPNVGYVDERPDINILNQASIRDDFRLDFKTSYGLTRWLAMEAGASYMNSPVGNIEFYTRNVHQGITAQNSTGIDNCGTDPAHPSLCWGWTPQSPDETRTNTFMPVGTITEIPLHLSGLIRFRPESPLDPYIGLGFGYILADLKTGDEFNRTAAFFGDPNFRVTSASEGEYTTNRCNREGLPVNVGCTDFHPAPLEANVKNSWEWHAIGGVDYYTSDHFSVYVDARYVWTSGSVDIRTDHAHQVRFAKIDDGVLQLRVQGKLQADGTAPYDPANPATWYLWEDMGVPANQNFQDNICPKDANGNSMCRNSGYLETEDRNMSGTLDARCADPTHPLSDFCEDIGVLYRLLPGSRDVDEALKIDCPLCKDNGLLDTEDANANGFLDRFLVYGIDICTTPQGNGNIRCQQDHRPPVSDMSHVTYIFPEGCPQIPEHLAPFETRTENGCPPLMPADPTSGARPTVQGTGVDNAADTYIIQGGRIRMGGFSLGVGFKFSF